MKFPIVSLILVAGLCAGADVLAAEEPLAGQAWQLADGAYKAYGRKNYAAAEAQAARALALRPDVERLWLLRIYALQHLGRNQQALEVAEQAMRRGHRGAELAEAARNLRPAPAISAAAETQTQSPAWELADAAYKDYAAGRYAEAEGKARSALRLQPDDLAMHRLLVYALERQDRVEQAASVADEALRRAPGDPALRALSEQMHQRLAARDSKAGSAMGGGATPGYEAASRAYAAMAAKDYGTAAEEARQAVEQAPDHLAYRFLLVNALALSGQERQAREAFEPLAQLAELPPDLLLEGAYAAQRLSRNELASRWFSQAIDASDAGRIALQPQQRMYLRQAVTDLERSWGANFALGYGTVGVMNPVYAPSLSARKTLQATQELYWRPPVVGNRNGSTLEVYARTAQALYDGTGGTTGLPTNQGVLGVRWKPFSQQNYVLALERLLPIGGRSRTDWLLRAAWSAGEGGGLRADRSDWRYWQIYAEADRFLKQTQTLGTLDVRYGRAFRMDSVQRNLVVSPYLGLVAGYDSLLARRGTVGAGPGMAMRLWFREDTHHAPRSFVDLNLQYRLRLGGDDRSRGVFFGLLYAY